jgi:uncharacterized membrane protein YhhN
LTGLAAITTAIDIEAVYFGPGTNVYIFKPLTTALIIAIALTVAGERRGYRRLIVAGLCFSLVGDVLLMLPSDQFVPGLLSFLIAHLLYTAAFKSRIKGSASARNALACVVYGGFMLWLLFPRLGDMKLPVSIYLLVILTMAWRALNRWAITQSRGAMFAAVGAIVFVASDSMIAFNRFFSPFRLAELLILMTYFTAQWLIAISVAWESSVGARPSRPLGDGRLGNGHPQPLAAGGHDRQ